MFTSFLNRFRLQRTCLRGLLRNATQWHFQAQRAERAKNNKRAAPEIRSRFGVRPLFSLLPLARSARWGRKNEARASFFDRLFTLAALWVVCFAPVLAPTAFGAETGGAANVEDPFAALRQGVLRFTLSNGMRVVFYRRENAPIFAGQVWVKVGGVDEVPGATGISHFLEHMAFKGTQVIGTRDYAAERPLLNELDLLMAKKREGGNASFEAALEERISAVTVELEKLWVDNEFARIYQRNGANGLNAMTGKDSTIYVVSLPANAFELWALMESERLFHPVFRQFYKEREVVMEERRSNYDDNPDGKLYEALLSASYWAHPYRLPLIGWPDDLKNITADQVERLHKSYYIPQNIVVGIVGNLEPERVRGVLEKYFGRIPAAPPPRAVIGPPEPPQQGERTAKVEFNASPALMMAYHKPVYPSPDDLYFSVLHSVLAEGRSSLLYRELVQQKQLAAAVDTGEAPGERFPSLFYVSATPKGDVTAERLRDEIQAIFKRLAGKDVPAGEIEAAKRRVKVNLLGSLTSNSGLASLLAKSELYWDDWQVLFKMYETIERTSAADLKRLAADYLTPENRTVVYLKRRSGISGASDEDAAGERQRRGGRSK